MVVQQTCISDVEIIFYRYNVMQFFKIQIYKICILYRKCATTTDHGGGTPSVGNIIKNVSFKCLKHVFIQKITAY